MSTRASRTGVLPPALLATQAGLTLIELMISLALGMLVVAAAIMLLLSSKTSFTIEDDTSRLLDAGRFSIENISRSVRQVAYENLGSDTAQSVVVPTNPAISGFDDSTFPDASGGTAGVPAPIGMTAHHSDILQLRFFPSPDDSVVNCAGLPAKPSSDGRSWSIYYVQEVTNGEPELRCGYLDQAGLFQSVAVASGVESFQVLYGVDLNGNGIPAQFMSAQTLTTPDPAVPDKTWDHVVAVKVALLMRGMRTQRADAMNETYPLFGQSYSDTQDIGSSFSEGDPGLPASERSRTRKVFSTTIQLRNAAAGGNITPYQ